MLDADIFARMLDQRRMPRGVSYRQAYFLTILAVRPSLTRADYQALVHISSNTAQLDIAELLAAGLIVRRGGGPSSRYCLVDSFGQIPLQAPRHHNRTGPQSPQYPREVAATSPASPDEIATGLPQSELEQELASIVRSWTHITNTRRSAKMAESDAMKDKVQGKLHEVKGAATGDTGEEMKGKLQAMKGDVQHNMNEAHREDVREEARREVNRRTP